MVIMKCCLPKKKLHLFTSIFIEFIQWLIDWLIERIAIVFVSDWFKQAAVAAGI